MLYSRASFLYIPYKKPISRPPTPTSPAGTSVSGPIFFHNSNIKAWQKRMISASDLPTGSKSEPPLPPPIGRVVSAFLNVCSKPKNFNIERFTALWKRRPPLYGPIALLNCTRYPRFVCTSPLSSTHVTRNVMMRSGSTIRSTILAFSNSGCWLYTSSIDSNTSRTA